MPNDPVLVHTCCGPCLCALLEPLRTGHPTFTAFFHNPNIQPLLEFRRRLKGVEVLADQERFPLVADDRYGLDAFLDAIGPDRSRPERCRTCYQIRLGATARHAAEHGFRVFTSTLLVSTQQDHELICEVGHEAAQGYGVAFDDTDFRSRQELGGELARRKQLYRQQYCGCIFSEYERFRHTTKHLYRRQRQPQEC